MELYRKVRLACRDGMSERATARHFGISRESVSKMLQFSVAPGYRRTAPVRRPKLDGFTGLIDRWLRPDNDNPPKQRHTAKRIFERLRDEHGFTGGYTIVKDYVREHRRRSWEMYVPREHPPGHAQADFGEAWAVIGAVKRKVHFFVFDLPHSDAPYVRAYPAAKAEAWVDGHVHAFSFFGTVPQSILYDNDRCLVSRIERDGTRRRTQLFNGFLSHYLIRDRYGRPGKGNDKGAVEGLVGWSRRNFMVPLPRFASFEAFNEYLERRCCDRQADVLREHRESIGERLEHDIEAMGALPAAPFDACHQASGQVSSQSLVRYQNNDYSVPVAYGYRRVWVRGYVERVVIGWGAEIIARHRRSYEGEDMVFDPLHYLALIERKIGALDQAAPLAGWELPDAFATLRRLMEARSGRAGRPEYVQVLRLLETFGLEDMHAAVKHALRLGAIGFDAVKHLILCRVERRPPRLDLDVYPYLPRANVAKTSAASYLSLMSWGRAMNEPPRILLEHRLKTLKLPTFLREYEKVARQSAHEGLDYVQFLSRLVDRERRLVERRIKAAKFSTVKSLDSFEFKAIPSVNKTQVLELARCEWIERRENVIALWPSGTGKITSHRGSGWPCASGGCRCALFPPRRWCTSSWRRATNDGFCDCRNNSLIKSC